MFKLGYLIGRNHVYMQRQSSYKVHLNTISNRELSDPLCDSVNRGLTLVRLAVSHTKESSILHTLTLDASIINSHQVKSI